MSLKLQIIGSQAAHSGMVTSKTFDGSGGSIGRSPDNQWVILGQYVSSRHARVHCREDGYYLEDTSTNGVSVGSLGNRLPKGQLQLLQTGDRIFIDDFEIAVTVDTPRRAAPQPMRLTGEPDPFENQARSPLDVPVISARGVESDPLRALGLERAPAPAPGPRLEDIDGGAGLRERMNVPQARVVPPSPPKAPTAGAAIPDDYNPLAPDGPPASHAPPVPRRPAPSQPPARTENQPPAQRPVPADPFMTAEPAAPRVPRPGHSGDSARSRHVEEPVPPPHGAADPLPAAPVATAKHPQLDLIALLEAAGVPAGSATPGLARELGQILRVVVSGLMDALHSRDKIKDEFRIRHTTFKSADNNPLKFSANVEDALYNLLVKRNPAYLGPVDAFEDGFTDVRHHQMAMLVGMRSAYDAMLRRFDPQMLQERFDESGRRGALLAMPARMRYWEQFSEHYRDMVKDSETSFRELFGAEFTRAYEEQLLRLRTLSRSQKRDS